MKTLKIEGHIHAPQQDSMLKNKGVTVTSSSIQAQHIITVSRLAISHSFPAAPSSWPQPWPLLPHASHQEQYFEPLKHCLLGLSDPGKTPPVPPPVPLGPVLPSFNQLQSQPIPLPPFSTIQ